VNPAFFVGADNTRTTPDPTRAPPPPAAKPIPQPAALPIPPPPAARPRVDRIQVGGRRRAARWSCVGCPDRHADCAPAREGAAVVRADTGRGRRVDGMSSMSNIWRSSRRSRHTGTLRTSYPTSYPPHLKGRRLTHKGQEADSEEFQAVDGAGGWTGFLRTRCVFRRSWPRSSDTRLQTPISFKLLEAHCCSLFPSVLYVFH
jgi:hypothetical protein